MAKSKSHSKQHSSKSKVVQKGPQQGLPPLTKTTSVPNELEAVEIKMQAPKTPAFSAANSSLQKVTLSPPSDTPKIGGQTRAMTPSESHKLPPCSSPITDIDLAPEFAAPRRPTLPKASSQSFLTERTARETKVQSNQHTLPQRKRKGYPGMWIGTGLGALLLAMCGVAAGAYSKFASGDTIAPGVSIAGIPVGGLTPDAAKARLTTHFGQPRLSLIYYHEKIIQVPIKQLGAKLSIEPTVKKAFKVGRDSFLPNNLLRVYANSGNSKNFMLPIEWNKAQLVQGLRSINTKIAVPPKDARLRSTSFGLEVVPDSEGHELNVGSAAHLLQRKFYVGMPSLHVPSRLVEADIKATDLEGQDVQLAQYTTRFNPGLAGRTENLRIACRAIQNHVLMPNETFSFNECTGERTADKGYRMAHIFQRQPGATESEVVDGLAGGVCQVSSTLFNAVRKTNAKAQINPIKIIERTTHSLPVTYVPRGLDATVAWPYKDFKFRNVTDHPIYVQTQMSRSNLTISIWGRVPNSH